MNEQLNNSQGSVEIPVIRNHEEALVPDSRAQLTPAQMVERKLVSTLQRCPLMVSHLQNSARSRF